MDSETLTAEALDTLQHPPAASLSAKQKEWQNKLNMLHVKRNAERNQNRKEMVAEDKRSKQPANWEAKRRRMQWELDEAEREQAATAAGEDYSLRKQLDTQVDQLEKQDAAKRRKKNPDAGFSTFENATARQYQRLTRQIKPNLSEYSEEKDGLGEQKFYATSSTMLINERKDKPEGIERLVKDVENQVEKRSKFSRRRGFDADEANINFINDRNRKFNEKLERFYDEYTGDIKANLERGTAL